MLLHTLAHLVLHSLIVVLVRIGGILEAHADRLGNILGANVGGEDDDGVAEVHLATLSVRHATFVENLHLQGVVDTLVGLFDLVEEHHGERLATHLLGELATLFVAHVSGGGTEEAGDLVGVVVLAHIYRDEGIIVTKQELGQCLRQLSLTHTGGAGEDKGTGGTLRVFQAGAGAADRAGHGLHCLILADDAFV